MEALVGLHQVAHDGSKKAKPQEKPSEQPNATSLAKSGTPSKHQVDIGEPAAQGDKPRTPPTNAPHPATNAKGPRSKYEVPSTKYEVERGPTARRVVEGGPVWAGETVPPSPSLRSERSPLCRGTRGGPPAPQGDKPRVRSAITPHPGGNAKGPRSKYQIRSTKYSEGAQRPRPWRGEIVPPSPSLRSGRSPRCAGGQTSDTTNQRAPPRYKRERAAVEVRSTKYEVRSRTRTDGPKGRRGGTSVGGRDGSPLALASLRAVPAVQRDTRRSPRSAGGQTSSAISHHAPPGRQRKGAAVEVPNTKYEVQRGSAATELPETSSKPFVELDRDQHGEAHGEDDEPGAQGDRLHPEDELGEGKMQGSDV